MIHVISATATTDGRRFAMCGKMFESYDAMVNAGHVVGNYATPAQIRQWVTCPDCLKRCR